MGDRVSSSPGMTNPMTTQDDIIVGGVGGIPTRLPKGTSGSVPTVDSITGHITMEVPPGFANPMTTQDDIIVGGASGVPTRLVKGTPGSVLTSDSVSGHVAWDGPVGFANPMTTQDDIIIGGVAGVPARLAKGLSGQVPIIDTVTGHITWEYPSTIRGSSGAFTSVDSFGRLFQTRGSEAAPTFISSNASITSKTITNYGPNFLYITFTSNLSIGAGQLFNIQLPSGSGALATGPGIVLLTTQNPLAAVALLFSATQLQADNFTIDCGATLGAVTAAQIGCFFWYRH